MPEAQLPGTRCRPLVPRTCASGISYLRLSKLPLPRGKDADSERRSSPAVSPEEVPARECNYPSWDENSERCDEPGDEADEIPPRLADRGENWILTGALA